MSGRTILVTGAAGYIGRHVTSALLDMGDTVTAITRPGSRSEVDPRAKVVAVDILGTDFAPEELADTAPDAIIHLAWQDGFNHNAPSHIDNLSSHYRFISSMVEWGVPKIAVLGTMHEIGYWEGVINADTPTNPTSLYGIAKDALRRALFASYSDKVSLQWLRCYYILGDDRNNRSVFARLLEAADEGRTHFPFTSGTNLYDFIHVNELGRQIATINANELAGVINCCTGRPVSLGEKMEEFIMVNDLDVTLDYGAFPDRPYDSPGVWGDATLINRLMSR